MTQNSNDGRPDLDFGAHSGKFTFAPKGRITIPVDAQIENDGISFGGVSHLKMAADKKSFLDDPR